MRTELLILTFALIFLVGCGSNTKSLYSENRTCEDTDNGTDYFVKGDVTVCDFNTFEEPGANIPIGCALHEDFCVEGTVILYENYCQGDDFRFETSICENGCKEGACIR